MKIITLVLRMMTKLFGSEKMWEAFKEIAERRTTIKIAKFEEKEEIRELRNDIKEDKLKKKKSRREKR